ncbi:MAG: hypothetical protein ACT4QC_13915 [Planctomycetaceae bacterium]
MSPAANARRGAFLIVVIVCLVLSTLLLAVQLRGALLIVRQGQMEHCAAQADWLKDAGLARAARRLQSDPAYSGETWNIPASELAGPDEARVIIQVQPAEAADREWHVSVESRYPADGALRVRRSGQSTIKLPRESES